MKKSIFALAALGLVAGAASAQTNVTVYGVLDESITRVHNNSGTKTGLDSGSWAGSRIGFKGTEDLGGGLSAIFTIEAGFSADTGAGSADGLFNRQSFVGLSSKTAGTVTFGRQKTSIYEANSTIDPFGDGMAGYAGSNPLGVTGSRNFFNEIGTRWNNTVRYFTPDFAGFTAKVGYKFGEETGDNSAGRGYDVGLNYANGPVNVIFAFNKDNADPTTTPGSSGTNDRKAWQLGGTYNFGVAKLALMYGQHKEDAVATGLKVVDDRNYLIGATVPFGSLNVLASFMRSDERLATDRDFDRYSIGATYALSKRTTLYTSAGYEKGRNGADEKANLLQVGMNHTF